MEGFDPSEASIPYTRITSIVSINEDQVKLRDISGSIIAIYNQSLLTNLWFKKVLD